MMRRVHYGLATGLAALILAATACNRHEPVTPDREPAEDGEVELVFSSGVSMESRVWTKTRNTVEVEEDRIIGAALAIYDSKGVLVHTDKVEGEFTGFSQPVKLFKEKTYSCYLVTGYIAGKIVFPDNVEDLPSLEIENTQKNGNDEYDMTATLRDYGPDRAGSIVGLTPALLDKQDGLVDSIVTIPVKSLWAKVSVSFDTDAITAYTVGVGSGGTESCGALLGSRVFYPFAPDGGTNISDKFSLLPIETRNKTGGVPEAQPFIFFVPENMLGDLLENNTDSDKKTPAQVRAIHGDDVALAVERSAVTVSSPVSADWGDTGTITYRFCIGDNPTSNFDIRRNTLYEVVLTATENGYAIKDWKAQLDLNDRRTMLFRSAARKVDGSGTPYFVDTAFVEINPSGLFYLVPDYTAKRINRTVAHYEKSPGWRLTTESANLLESLGISYSLVKKYVYINAESNDVFYTDEQSASLDDIYYEIRRVKTDLLVFTPTADLTVGTAFPITVQTHDAAHTATVTVQVKAGGSAVVEWTHEPQYIGQQGLLSTTAMTGSVKNVSFSVPAQYSDYIEIDASAGNSTCIVKAKKAGNAFVSYTGRSAQGTEICSGSVPVAIRAPLLRAGTSVCNLSADGTAVTLSPYYISRDGADMSVAASDALGYGDKFAPSLYNALLAPQVGIADSDAAPFLGASGTQVYVAGLETGGQAITGLLGSTFSDALTISAKAAPDVSPADCDIFLKTPLGYNGADTRLATIENHVVTGLTTAHSSSNVVRKGASTTISGLNFTLGANLANLTIEEAGDMTFTIGSGGSLTITGKNAPTALTAGRKILYARLRNTRSSQTVSVPSGYLEIYLHTVPQAILNLNVADPEVSTDIAGADLSPALASMRQALFANAAAVKCSFFDVHYYSLGQGYWNYPDEIDNAGNQYVAPDQSGMMTVFIETSWPGMAKFGQVAYKIEVGNIEAEYGMYDSMAAFLSWHQAPHLLMDYSGLTCVKKSTLNNYMYHYNYGSEKDSYGYSYYILDFINIPDWKQ